MPNPNQMQEEAAELQTLQQIDQLAKSGDPNALPQISQLVEQMIQAQQAEMKELQGEDQPEAAKPSLEERLKARMLQQAAAKQAMTQSRQEAQNG